jgi:hypothetical protein
MKGQRHLALLLILLLPACGSKAESETAPAPSEAGVEHWHWNQSNADGFWGAWRMADGPLEMGPSFAIEIQLAHTRAGAPLDPPIQHIAVGARMPEHQHGMLQTVTLERLGPGYYRVDGMRFHMLGYWQLQVDVTRPPITERAQFDIHL